MLHLKKKIIWDSNKDRLLENFQLIDDRGYWNKKYTRYNK